MLIKNNIDIEVKDTIKDTEGRYIQLNVMLEGKSLSLVNLYGLKKDNPEFFTKVQNKVETADTDFQIIAGDFNSVLDNEMDKLGNICTQTRDGKLITSSDHNKSLPDWIVFF